MHCSYCNESAHPMAKFCPKCGLPLAGAAQSGAYVVDDTGPNLWLLGLGAVGVLVLALGVGWASARSAQKPEEVRREPVGRYAAAAPSAAAGAFNPGMMRPFNQASAAPRVAPTPPSVNYNYTTRWAWTPPPAPAYPVQPVMEAPAPPPPPHILGLDLSFLPELPRRTPLPEEPMEEIVEVIQAPLPPEAPPAYAQQAPVNVTGAYGYSDPRAMVDPRGTYPPILTPEAPLVENTAASENWVYDPVQDRWARQSERAPRRYGPVIDSSRPLPSARGSRP
jgi:hypothetical protein